MAKAKKRDLRDEMWQRGPADVDSGKGEALQQARENIDPDNPGIVRPDFGKQAEGQTTSN
jgi:hypothetical protein